MANDNLHWSSEQIIENASSWSLAGDVALLTSLRKFSESLLLDTEALNGKVNNLLNNLENVSLTLELTKNEFQSLRNTQFIENRVYEDDDEVLDDEKTPDEKEPTEEDKENVLKRSISKGLKIMQNYYDKVELALSDSEGEGNEKSYVMQPKDPYIDRPLPYLVGSHDWYKKWHVGLLASDSESESEKEHEVYSSSSDTEEFLPKNRVLGSETSSELDFANKNTGPVANSTFNESQDNRRDMFLQSSDESSEQSNSIPAKTPISNAKFAEQLAAKLGDVVSGRNEKVDVPIKPTPRAGGNLFSEELSSSNDVLIKPTPRVGGNLFSDEPPPLDDLNDTVLPKSAHEGLFSSGRNLFAENNEDDSFWGSPSEKTDTPNDSMTTSKPQQSTLVSKIKVSRSRGLFDDSDSSSEEDMLTVTEKRKKIGSTIGKVNPYMQTYNKTPVLPFVDDEPPDITPKNDNLQAKKKPVGGFSILGENANIDIFASKNSNQQQNNIGSLPISISNKTIDDDSTESVRKPVKKNLLFDESSDEEIFTPKQKQSELSKPGNLSNIGGGKSLNLFEDSDDFTSVLSTKTNAPIVSNNQPKSATSQCVKKISLFDDDDISEKNDNLFSDTKTSSNKPKKKINLFDDDDEDFLKEEEEIFAPKQKESYDTNLSSDHNVIFDDLEKSALSEASGKSKSGFEDDDEKDVVKKVGKNTLKNLVDSEVDSFVPSIQANIKVDEKSRGLGIKEDVLIEENLSEDSVKVPKIDNLLADNAIDDEPEFSQASETNTHTTKDNEAISDAIMDSNTEQHNAIGKEPFTNSKKDENNSEKYVKNVSLFHSEGDSDEKSIIVGENKEKNDVLNQSFKEEPFATFKGADLPQEADLKPADSSEGDIGAVDVDIKPRYDYSVPPPINIFDPTPPPVDWDASSDNSVDSDRLSLTDGLLDRTSYVQSQPTVSSLFDDAPPSLDINDINYSSGIIRDINVTRVDTDESLFYPHASSSRRLSSDIFSDQQSQDSFFVTKSTSEHIASHGSGLDKILESSEDFSSKIENLTPSGNVADLEDSGSVFEKSSNELEGEMDSTSKLGIQKPVVNAPSVLLLKAELEQHQHKDESVKPQNKSSPGKLKHNLNINVGALLPGASVPKIRPPVLKSSSADETDQLVRPSVAPRRPIPIVRQKSEPSQGSVASEGFDDLAGAGVLQSVTKDRARIQVKRRPSTRRARLEAVQKSMTDPGLHPDSEPSLLDKQIKNVSAKAVAELDKSNPDLPSSDNNELIQEAESQNVFNLPTASTDTFQSQSPKSSLFSDLDEESNDLFQGIKGDNKGRTPAISKLVDKVLENSDHFKNLFAQPYADDVSGDNFKSSEKIDEVDQSSEGHRNVIFSEPAALLKPQDSSINSNLVHDKTTQKVKNLFGDHESNSDSDDDLFSSGSTKKCDEQAKEKAGAKGTENTGLFDNSDDSDSGLFGGKIKTPISMQDDKQKNVGLVKKERGLFDDEDSEDDLFAPKAVKPIVGNSRDVQGTIVPPRRVEIKTASVRKLENKEVTDFDPLSGFKK